jgi:hypothetical protein
MFYLKLDEKHAEEARLRNEDAAHSTLVQKRETRAANGDQVRARLKRITHLELLELVEAIRQDVFTKEAWLQNKAREGMDDDGKGGTLDEEFLVHVRFLWVAETFKVLRHATKHGDIRIVITWWVLQYGLCVPLPALLEQHVAVI